MVRDLSFWGQEFSANTFNDHWNNNNIKPEIKELNEPHPKISQHNTMEHLPTEKPHVLFDFLNKEVPVFSTNETVIIESLGGLLPEAQGENYEEMDFANKMKKKRNRKRNQK